jgi:hypothetical protein
MSHAVICESLGCIETSVQETCSRTKYTRIQNVFLGNGVASGVLPRAVHHLLHHVVHLSSLGDWGRMACFAGRTKQRRGKCAAPLTLKSWGIFAAHFPLLNAFLETLTKTDLMCSLVTLWVQDGWQQPPSPNPPSGCCLWIGLTTEYWLRKNMAFLCACTLMCVHIN